MTFALPVEDHLAVHQVALVAGLAVRNAVAELSGRDEIGLKWPNDVMFDCRKVAGLLCERVDRLDLIGVGLNVNLDPSQVPVVLRHRVTSVAGVAGHAIDATESLLAVARHLRQTLRCRDEKTFAAIVQDYDRYHVLKGQRVTVSDSGSAPSVGGRCQGLDHLGRLRLCQDRKVHYVISGRVELA